MIYLLFLISTLLAIWYGYSKDKLAREGKRVTAAFVSSALPFVISLGVASGIFASVAILIYWADQDSRTIDTLYLIETKVHSFHDEVSEYKLSTWKSVAILAALWLIPLIRVRVLRHPHNDGLGRGIAMASAIFRKYSKAISLVVTFLTLMASFSFFASAVESGLGRLQVRLKTAEETIKKVGAGLSSAFSEEVVREVIKSVQERAPEAVSDRLNRVDVVYEKEKHLENEYRQVRYRVDEIPKRRPRVPEVSLQPGGSAEKSKLRHSFDLPQDAIRPVLTSLGGDTLHAHAEALRDRSKENKPALTQVEDQRKLTKKIIDGVMELGFTMAKNLFSEVPLAEPLLDVAKDTMSNLAAESVEPYFRKLLETTESSLNNAIRDVAQRFVTDNARVEDAWGKYMRDHPEKVQQEQHKLEQWEKRIETERVNYEARARERTVLSGKENARNLAELGPPGTWYLPLNKTSPSDQTGRGRTLSDITTAARPETDLNTSKRPNEPPYGRGLKIEPRPPRPKGPRK